MIHERGIQTLRICLTEDLLDRLAQAEHDDNVEGMVAGHHPSFIRDQVLSLSIEPADKDLRAHKECRYQIVAKIARGPEVLAEWLLNSLSRNSDFIEVYIERDDKGDLHIGDHISNIELSERAFPSLNGLSRCQSDDAAETESPASSGANTDAVIPINPET